MRQIPLLKRERRRGLQRRGHASRIDYVCAPQDLLSAVTGAGTCEEVLLQTGGRVDHLPVFADVSIQPLQGIKNVQRKNVFVM